MDANVLKIMNVRRLFAIKTNVHLIAQFKIHLLYFKMDANALLAVNVIPLHVNMIPPNLME
jgi:hypothetical protein